LLLPPAPLPRGFSEREGGLDPAPTAGRLGARGPPRVAAALARVERDRALEVGEPRDERHQVADADLAAGGEVDALEALELLGGEHDALGQIRYVEEVARGRAVAPHHQLGVDEALADGRRDHVRDLRIEAVA